MSPANQLSERTHPDPSRRAPRAANRVRRTSAGLILGTVLLLLATPSLSGEQKPRLMLEIESPIAGAVIGDPGGMAFLAGKALALYGEFQTFDIVFVVDVSESTSQPSGADIDGDGEIGVRKGEGYLSILAQVLPLPLTDEGDSILAAEVQAVRVMLDQLDPRTTRVGVVVFAGDGDPLTPDAYTQVPLTSDYGKVRKGLKEILSDGPRGKTNMMTGVFTATVELIGSPSAYSEPREGARRIMIFLTDGEPTLPLEAARNQNARMAIQAARQAARHQIRIDTYAIGEKALGHPVVTVEMAHVTKGVFTPVRHPRDLRAIFEEVNFADIEKLEIYNKTTGRPGDQTMQNADGTFSSLVPMREGMNTLEVYARSTDGTEARRRVRVKFLESGAPQDLNPRLLAQRNRLMENQLLELKRRSLEIQTARDESVRRDLTAEIEQERAAAKERAARQKKELEIAVE
jgi:hypothetical protein